MRLRGRNDPPSLTDLLNRRRGSRRFCLSKKKLTDDPAFRSDRKFQKAAQGIGWVSTHETPPTSGKACANASDFSGRLPEE
jgi:hypothetical protein